MMKRSFLIFALVIGVLVAASVGFIQSAEFAGLFKRGIAKYLPSDTGLEGDFSEFAIRLFPPSLSIRNPHVAVTGRNMADLPLGSKISAERIDLVFLPFQMFSGNIQVHRAVVVNGEIQLAFDRSFMQKTAAPKGGLSSRWDQLLKIHAQSIALENTRVRLQLAEPALSLTFVARSLSVEQWAGKGGLGYELELDFQEIYGKFPKEWKLPAALNEYVGGIKGNARVNALGLQLEELLISRNGLELRSSGAIKGNLLAQKGDLLADLELTAKGELARILSLVSASSGMAKQASGDLSFSGRLKGNLEHPLETLKIDGGLQLKKAKFKAWTFDQVVAEGSWAANPNGGELLISRVLAEAQERARVGGSQPGWGGKVQAGPIKIPLASKGPLSLPLRLERAHLHWLAAPGLEDIYPLNFRVSGPVDLIFVPAKEPEGDPWSVIGRVDLKIDDFQLDNQHLGKVKPLQRVLKIPQISLQGGIVIDEESFQPDNLTLSLPRSKFQVTGEMNFETGYNLHADGSVNLEDVGTIAENVIRGEGLLTAHILGPSSRTIVDFDAKLKNSYYLNLNIGDLNGRITWDDDPSFLIFKNVEAKQGKTGYRVNGQLDLGDIEKVNLDVDVYDGSVKEFAHIFDFLTKDLWWFPRSLDGDLAGLIKVRGGLGLDQLIVQADLHGSAWEWLGEKLKAVSLAGGYDKGKYYLESVKANKHNGRLSGHISFDAQSKFDWELKTEGLSVSDIDHVARLDVPIRGKLSLSSVGHGKEGAIESRSTGLLTEFSVRGMPMSPSSATLKSSGGIATLNGEVFGGQSVFDLVYNFKPNANSYLRTQCRGLDFTPVLLMLNPGMIHDRDLVGKISGMVDLKFRSGEFERSSGKIEFNDYVLGKTGTQFNLVRPVSVKVDHGSFDLENVTLKSGTSEAKLSLVSRAAELEGKISGNLDVSIAEFLTSTVAQARGLADLDFALGGTIKEPMIFGKASLDNVAVLVASVDSPFENVTGAIQLRQNVISVQNIQGELATGRINGGGTIELFPDRYPKIDLSGNLIENRLKVYPFQFAKVRGRIRLHGEAIPYDIDGAVRVESAFSKEKMLVSNQSRMLKSARYMPQGGPGHEGDYPMFRLGIDVSADEGIFAQNDLLDVELKAKIKLVNTLEAPRLLGTAEVLQGKLIFKDRVFQIQSAKVDFDNPTVINPRFSLSSIADLGGTKIQLYASGRMEDYKIEFSSNPVLPEAEILSILTLGMTSDEVKRLKTSDRGAVEQTEAASLVLHSLDFNRDVQDKTGLQIKIDEAVNTQAGSSIFRPRSDTESTAAPKIVIKKQIGKRLDLSVGSTVGMGTNKQQEVNAEVHLTPGLSLIGVWDAQEEADASNNKTTTGSYGLDLKLQKRFK